MWIITHDILEHCKKIDVRSGDYDESLKENLIYRFRLLDGDSVVYYEGLSDEIQYLQNGIWLTL